jgi:hypothetical protein
MSRPGGWKSGLVWRTVGLALVLSVVPAAVATIANHFDYITCQAATKDLPKNTVIADSDLAAQHVRRSRTPRNPILQHNVAGWTLVTALKKGDCASVKTLRAPLSAFELPLAKASVLGTPKAGGTVDLLFAPSDAEDTHDGASVDNVIVVSIDEDSMVVRITKEQQQTILKYVARSRLFVRAR